jgi:hypothetical protein
MLVRVMRRSRNIELCIILFSYSYAHLRVHHATSTVLVFYDGYYGRDSREGKRHRQRTSGRCEFGGAEKYKREGRGGLKDGNVNEG